MRQNLGSIKDLTLQDINTTPKEPKTERGVVAVDSFLGLVALS